MFLYRYPEEIKLICLVSFWQFYISLTYYLMSLVQSSKPLVLLFEVCISYSRELIHFPFVKGEQKLEVCTNVGRTKKQ